MEQSEWWWWRLEERRNGGGPWGQGPSGGGGSQQPDLEEMLKRGQDKVKQVMHGGGIPGPLLFLIAMRSPSR